MAAAFNKTFFFFYKDLKNNEENKSARLLQQNPSLFYVRFWEVLDKMLAHGSLGLPQLFLLLAFICSNLTNQWIKPDVSNLKLNTDYKTTDL